MSKLDQVQLGSIPFNPVPMFTTFQQFGETTTLHALPASMAIPVPVAGSGSANPVYVFDNRNTRATSALISVAVTAANNTKVAMDCIGFSKIVGTSLYLRTKFFLGEAQAGNIDVSVPLAEATAFLCDNFSLKTFAGFNVSYIEPADDIAAALIVIDIRGYDYLMVRFAQGAATAATKVQGWIGVN